VWIGHLLGAGVWIGGLVGLLACARPGAVGADYRPAFWPAAIRRFSILARGCVAALVLSGLWLYWVHIDGAHQLVSTLYGRVLGVKLIVFGALLVIGAFNQFWLSPRLETLRADGEADSSLGSLLSRHFRTAIAVEVLLGLTVVLIAPFLRGSSRNQAFQAKAADLTRIAQLDGQPARFTPSGLIPGRTDYTVRLRDHSAKQVSVTFSSDELGVPNRVVPAARIASGTYRASGYLTPQVGLWQASVQVDNGSVATFSLPIKASAAKLPKSPTPPVRWTTWTFGILETLGVSGAMLAAFTMSGRLARRRRSAAAEPGRGGDGDNVPDLVPR
jgi:uncharacterized membrane protein